MKLIPQIFIGLIVPLSAAIIEIPNDYPSIQVGMDSAAFGDTVLVHPGTYSENVHFNGLNLPLTGEFGLTGDTASIGTTVLDGGGLETVILIDNPNDTAARVLGLTIQNGLGNPVGTYATAGGVTCKNGASSSLSHLVIRQNSGVFGGGILLRNADSVIRDCSVSGNSASFAGGILIYNSSATILRSAVTGNSASNTAGGIYIYQSAVDAADLFISQNISEQTAGGIHLVSSDVAFQTSRIARNISQSNGGGLFLFDTSPTLINCVVDSNTALNNGGGFYCIYSSDPVIQSSRIQANHAENNGGAIYGSNNSQILLESSHIIYNTAGSSAGGIYCTDNSVPQFHGGNRCSVYLNIGGYAGNEIRIDPSSVCQMPLDTFTVMFPTDYHITPLSQFNFDINASKLGQVSADLFVDPSVGNNANSGLTSASPLRSIHYALSIILPDSQDTHTIHLANGIYSPSSNNEYFPVTIPDYISLEGSHRDSTILDAEQTARVITIDGDQNLSLSNLTVTGGSAIYGGGISIHNSMPEISNITIANNQGTYGGGIYLNDTEAQLTQVRILQNNSLDGAGIYLENSSTPVLDRVQILENTAGNHGGGVYCDAADPWLTAASIHHNTAQSGGGFYFTNAASAEFDTLERSSIYLNAGVALGQDLYNDFSPGIAVVLDTFTVLYPIDYHAFPRNAFSFSIQHGMIEQVQQDLYVSPDGDNLNAGLTPDAPLKTISFALSKILDGLTAPITLFLSPGIFSPSTNAETFPINWRSNINLVGESPQTTILDAEGSGSVILMDQYINVNIENLTIRGGQAPQGGGVQLIVSHPNFNSVRFIDNHAVNYGGAISASFSSPTFQSVQFSGNSAVFGGAAYFLNANPEMDHVILANNSATGDNGRGGGIYLQATSIDISHGSFSGNSAQDGGGAIFLYASTATVVNSILWNNGPKEAEFSPSFTASNFISVYNDIRNGVSGIHTNNNGVVYWEAGNLSQNPVWADPVNGDFSLNQQSPCINGGTAYFDCYGNVIIDLDSSQYTGIAPDMGAVESEYLIAASSHQILPATLSLSQNYPNPFNPVTTIKYDLPEATHVKLVIFDLLGREAAVLVNSYQPPGAGEIRFDAGSMAGGMYFYRLTTNKKQITRKMVVLK